MQIYRILRGIDRIPINDLFYMLQRAKDGKRTPWKYRRLLRRDFDVRNGIDDSGLAHVTQTCDLELTGLGLRIAEHDKIENLPKELQEKLREPVVPLAFPYTFAKRIAEITRAGK